MHPRGIGHHEMVIGLFRGEERNVGSILEQGAIVKRNLIATNQLWNLQWIR